MSDQDRRRCRGDNHRPNCAHLGLDPERRYCRGDKHAYQCAHLFPKAAVIGRPRVNRVRQAALLREAHKRPKTGLNSKDVSRHVFVAEKDHAPHKSTPQIGPYLGTGGLLEQGRLSQTCPCGITEAAGSYCTRCLRPMSEVDWYAATKKTAAA